MDAGGVAPAVARLVEGLGLEPHPEGGWYREIHRSPAEVTPGDGRGPRSALTLIWFLLAEGVESRWHRVASDEICHFCGGDALVLRLGGGGAQPAGAGERTELRLGALSDDAAPVHVVPAGTWQSARTAGAWTLVACAVGPGFDFEDFRLHDPGLRLP